MVSSSSSTSSTSQCIITTIAADASSSMVTPITTPTSLPTMSSLFDVAPVDHQHGKQDAPKNQNIPPTTVISANENLKSRIILATRLMGDVVVAVTVTAMAAPFLAVIDKALVERTTAAASSANTTATASTRNRITVWTSMYHSSIAILQQPTKFLRSPTFLWMWGTYAATYTAANTLRTLFAIGKTPHTASLKPEISPTTTNHNNNTVSTFRDDKHSRGFSYSNYLPSAGTSLLIGTSIVNSTASVMKDRAYAQLYGAGTTTSTTTTSTSMASTATATKLMVPKITYGLWLLRDLTVISAAFVLPNHVAQFWIQKQQQHKATTSKPYSLHCSDATIIRLSQIGTPVLAQVIAGPLHFIGYDCYNHYNAQAVRGGTIGAVPQASSLLSSYQFWSERLHNLRSSVGQVIMARMMRIIPGYGIAGICNTELLLQWRHRIVQPMIDGDVTWYHNHGPSNTSTMETCTTMNTAAVWNEHHQHRC